MGGSMRSTCSCFAIFALLLRSGAVDGDVGQGAPDESEEGPPLSLTGEDAGSKRISDQRLHCDSGAADSTTESARRGGQSE